MITEAFKGKKPSEIRELLEANSEIKERRFVDVPLTSDELLDIRTELADTSGKVYALEVEKKKITDKFKAQLKPLQKIVSERSAMVHHKTQQIESDVYGIADHENGMMHFYLPDGTFLNSRRLNPEERQLRISSKAV